MFVDGLVRSSDVGDYWVTRSDGMGNIRLTKGTVAKLLQAGAASTSSTIYWDLDLGGFGLRHYRSGAASYVVDFRLKGSRVKRRVVLGSVELLAPEAAKAGLPP